jgi:peptidoglycan/LPS O-acetylase OafA/YrhL
VVFIIGVYLCIFAALFGCKNDPSRIILGHWIFSPLAKVSFCIYLTHFIVIMNGVFSVRMDLYWQTSSILYIVISDIFWSILLATCLSCLIEAPILSLERLFLRPDKKKAKE